ncbi:unnamed protein product [Cylicostephanus goldi]|uniref:Uncharacterized protein n=1 Tax=Cylicostephanus goldi TaxID=71465 RepID=A0A3P6Q8Z9_CYLGO|nr:unnamed protein product [Cylicostephanus goldi]
MISKARNLLSMFYANNSNFWGFLATSQLILIHQILTTNIEKMKTTSGKEHKSCLLLPPVRFYLFGSKVPIFYLHSRTALIFSSNLVYSKNFDKNDSEHIQRLDPFVSLVTQCLEFKYEKVITNALRCLIGMLYLSLPSLQKSLKQISERLFILLSEYSVLGSAANKESVLALNQLLCKTFTQLILMGDTPFLTDKHVSLLLSYVEMDVLDTNRQATAFALIKALVRKKVEHSQISDVMKKLRELSITSSYPHIRTQCREVLCEFVGNHPCSDDPQKHIEWFIAQLAYELEDGRLSAADMLNSLFSRLKPVRLHTFAVLNNSCFYNISKMGPMLFNEESVKCRKFIAGAINKLLSSVSDSTRADVFSACSDWLELQEEEKVGALEAFGPRFRSILPSLHVLQQIYVPSFSERTISGMCYGVASMLQNMGEEAREVLALEDFCLLFGKELL